MCLCGLISAQSSGVWLDVPYVQQEKNGCGAAVIAMILEYWQKQQPVSHEPAINPSDIQRTLFSADAQGIHASDMQRYFEEHGFQTFAFTGDWEMLRSHLQKGRPLVAALKPGKGQSSLHYVVVTGMDWDNNLVLLNDPAQKKLLKTERRSFEKEWNAVDRWTLLAVPK